MVKDLGLWDDSSPTRLALILTISSSFFLTVSIVVVFNIFKQNKEILLKTIELVALIKYE